MICHQCGAKVTRAMQHCKECGAPLVDRPLARRVKRRTSARESARTHAQGTATAAQGRAH